MSMEGALPQLAVEIGKVSSYKGQASFLKYPAKLAAFGWRNSINKAEFGSTKHLLLADNFKAY